jgi:short-subunit dehydrogenase
VHETALITGASGGIGEELARLFAKDQFDVVLIARSEEKLNALKMELENAYGVHAYVLCANLADPASPQRIVAKLAAEKIEVTALVNNAGFGAYGFFHQTDFLQEKEMLQVNVVALSELTKLLLPGMVLRKKGYILNVASTAAFQPGPLMAVYYASKAYVLSLSEALADELAGTGVQVTCLCPGPTKTGFAAHAKMGKSRLFTGLAMTAQEVALSGYHGMQAGKRVIIPGWKNTIMAFATRFVPHSFAAHLARRMQETKE